MTTSGRQIQGDVDLAGNERLDRRLVVSGDHDVDVAHPGLGEETEFTGTERRRAMGEMPMSDRKPERRGGMARGHRRASSG